MAQKLNSRRIINTKKTGKLGYCWETALVWSMISWWVVSLSSSLSSADSQQILVSPIVDAIYLHHTSKVIDLFISFLLAPGKLLMVFISILFFILFLRDFSRDTLHGQRNLSWLRKFFEMQKHLSSVSYLLRQWFLYHHQEQRHLRICRNTHS